MIISNSDLGYKGNTVPKAPAGTIHGGIENINGQWYVFYHRCTNNSDYSRQACAEPITILPDGTIPQVEITTQGLSGRPIPAAGSFPAAICCNLTTGKKMKLGLGDPQTKPRVTEENGEVFIAGIASGTELGYKYFRFSGGQVLNILCRGNAEGTWEVRTQSERLGEIPVLPSRDWTEAKARIPFPPGDHMLCLRYHGKGTLDVKTIGFVSM